VDTLTVIVHLNTPDPELLTKLAQVPFSIVSKTALEGAGGSYGMAGGAMGESGPYMVETWDSASLTLAPNPAYWGDLAANSLVYTIEP
jgi:ABC-type transport system substrate-binding protein